MHIVWVLHLHLIMQAVTSIPVLFVAKTRKHENFGHQRHEQNHRQFHFQFNNKFYLSQSKNDDTLEYSPITKLQGKEIFQPEDLSDFNSTIQTRKRRGTKQSKTQSNEYENEEIFIDLPKFAPPDKTETTFSTTEQIPIKMYIDLLSEEYLGVSPTTTFPSDNDLPEMEQKTSPLNEITSTQNQDMNFDSTTENENPSENTIFINPDTVDILPEENPDHGTKNVVTSSTAGKIYIDLLDSLDFPTSTSLTSLVSVGNDLQTESFERGSSSYSPKYDWKEKSTFPSLTENSYNSIVDEVTTSDSSDLFSTITTGQDQTSTNAMYQKTTLSKVYLDLLESTIADQQDESTSAKPRMTISTKCKEQQHNVPETDLITKLGRDNKFTIPTTASISTSSNFERSQNDDDQHSSKLYDLSDEAKSTLPMQETTELSTLLYPSSTAHIAEKNETSTSNTINSNNITESGEWIFVKHVKIAPSTLSPPSLKNNTTISNVNSTDKPLVSNMSNSATTTDEFEVYHSAELDYANDKTRYFLDDYREYALRQALSHNPFLSKKT